MSAEPPATYAPRFPTDRQGAAVPVEVVLSRAAPGPLSPAALAVLDGAERERVARFRRPQDAERFVTGRALARTLLGGRLGLAPEDVDLAVPRPGWKPRVPDTTLDVSIAHAADVVVVVLADGVEVGVDVEGGPGVLRTIDEQLWRSVTSPEERAAVGPLDWPSAGRPAPATVDAVLRHWVRKEAVLKAVRLGLVVPMEGLAVGDGPPPEVLATPEGLPGPAGIALADVDAPDGFRIAVAAVTDGPLVVRDADTGTVVGRSGGRASRG
ncbi:4'-phosphopantetheinyl transferase family protein [Patulibacter minatonensis]|uniref:4'-phosphopantetheinyl transferase family protein n=1 Tax=Patulibacter minatonensis TaxID=298163 RepID=UPI00047959F3|nr:4'-phosphopantetheinyl transferase superfamily protein [Patulibacter minatonensis]